MPGKPKQVGRNEVHIGRQIIDIRKVFGDNCKCDGTTPPDHIRKTRSSFWTGSKKQGKQ